MWPRVAEHVPVVQRTEELRSEELGRNSSGTLEKVNTIIR